MKKLKVIQIPPDNTQELHIFHTNHLVLGSGAAALNAAIQLKKQGMEGGGIVTKHKHGGVSYNSGSDKQTYYKLSNYGNQPDTPMDMATTLFQGGAMHGDHALIESSLSLPAFYHLQEAGVPFPKDEWGGFVGYKTDHDPRQRGTSVGPLTSQAMVKHLSKEAQLYNIPVHHAVEIIKLFTLQTESGTIFAALGVDLHGTISKRYALHVYISSFLVLALGGGGGIYEDSVYPPHHLTSIGLALELGAEAQNMTEWQFGIASLKPRWNLSGSYQQVLPRYYSLDPIHTKKHYFLEDYFKSIAETGTMTFLKGYQWPFDVRKIPGSSLVDLLVYREKHLYKRKVYLDFRENPGTGHAPFPFDELSSEVQDYLRRCNILFGTPIQRLEVMNPDAVALYRNRGNDLKNHPLEIGVCSQHANGGLAVDENWETNIPGLFAAGEICGTHGVYRPGGSALNSGQVAGYRIAHAIQARMKSKTSLIPTDKGNFHPISESLTEPLIAQSIEEVRRFLDSVPGLDLTVSSSKISSPSKELSRERLQIQHLMSANAGLIRETPSIKSILNKIMEKSSTFQIQKNTTNDVSLCAGDWIDWMRNRHLLESWACYLAAMLDYSEKGGKSRGSYLVGEQSLLVHLLRKYSNPITDSSTTLKPMYETIPFQDQIQIMCRSLEHAYTAKWIPPRPIPPCDAWFESVWAASRE